MSPLTSAAIVFAVALAASARELPKDLEPRIVGGSVAGDEDSPYTVSLRVYFEHFCGGSILNDLWVMTAAHCLVRKEANQISVIAGTIHLSESGQMYQAVKLVSHENYVASKLVNDIGLIRVSRKIVFTYKIQPIALPTADFTEVNYPAVLTGWGTDKVNGSLQELLQELNVNVMAQDACKKMQSLVTASHICTLSDVGQGACYGDAGGPLVADDTQIGIASFINPCAKGQPDVFTRVWTFVDWIKKTIQNNS